MLLVIVLFSSTIVRLIAIILQPFAYTEGQQFFLFPFAMRYLLMSHDPVINALATIRARKPNFSPALL